ncbi:NADP-dependent malic enzyme [Pseudobacteriovorax antillogorgiicola]|uniref:Malate dehydrogenase (Oxaloacetate-decarboxylating)(NADP+) n=1 Tax=Pseudobacteriovorax antillogorgiicola TaxID=1513793 RepID=A0A1Y6CQS3_9BACT|nr:NADP-dependent malic enzyme [Pseudobacteriovorax antillogorgiicola]TCS46642.1 allosteric NADP-dependent malic enzyme [Pseudobacteriovorax antillogorgiicola]SMF66293.1 malate dehydrogenase (oxaloacetate-decarboxylating)(NADP+) [Pseudobacteriovorax antillogorgiicola]
MNYEEKALEYHQREPAGKIQTRISKPLDSQEDLSIAYSPGVAGPCREIEKDPENSFKYTGRANLVGVISNGTAVLGLGNIGPHASKPVMEGKAMLFKKFADIDVFDIEVAAEDPDQFISTVKALEPTFGGINLEDIKAPECFYIEETLKEQMNIPVFHDDQHGTAIIASAAFINALEITNRDIADVKVVFSGGGAAAIACADLFIKLGVKPENLLMCDSRGVIHDGRDPGNPYKGRFSQKTDLRTLEEALVGADAFVGVSVAGVLTQDMIKPMAEHPIIFALANPDPEIHPDLAREVRPDAIIATGRSDFPNQVNNVLGFPFIFRGALDTQATGISDEMKLAAVKAISSLAKKTVPEEVLKVYSNPDGYQFGKDYLIPKPVDPRVLMYVAPAVAQAAMDSGVARKKVNIDEYKYHIERILGPTRRIVRKLRQGIVAGTQRQKKKPNILLPHGHDSRVIKAAAQIVYDGDVDVTLLGSPKSIIEKSESLGFHAFGEKVNIINPLQDDRTEKFADQLFELRQRKGISKSIAMEAIRNTNYFGAMLLKNGFVDGMLNGLVEPYAASVRPILEVLGTTTSTTLAGTQMISYRKKLYFFSDCTINVDPTPEQMASIAYNTAEFAKEYTDDPIKLAFLSFSSFGSNRHPITRKISEAARLLENMNPDFDFDGEIQADVAINVDLQKKEFPFSNLKGQANVLIFPDLMSANISYKLLANLTEASSFGPILRGPPMPAHVLERGARVEDIINMVYLTANQWARN